MTERVRVLLIAEAVTLAHVARTYSLARTLDPGRFDIRIACDPRYATLFDQSSFDTQSITTIPTQRFAAAIAKGSPIYDLKTLVGYVDEDRRAIDAFRPDVVVGDFRLSLAVSARLSRTPYVTVTNAGWSPYADIRFVVPDLPIARWFGVPIAQRLFDFGRPIAFAAHARPVKQLHRRFGLTAPEGDIRTAYTDADFILYADLPEMFSMRTMPESHAFLGPVQWSPSCALPEWWQALDPDVPVIYVTLGSSGQSRAMPALLDALGALPVSVIVATAGRIAVGQIPANVRVTDYLPGAAAAARSALVICNGGSPTCYQSFEAGIPVLGIPTNLDQYLNMQAVVSSGAGLLLRPADLRTDAIHRAVDSLLAEPGHRQRAAGLRDACTRHPAAKTFAATLERAAATGDRQPTSSSGPR